MITVTQRCRLEELIYAHRGATTHWTVVGGDGEPRERWIATYRELHAYLDELTDYATYEPTADPAGLLAG